MQSWKAAKIKSLLLENQASQERISGLAECPCAAIKRLETNGNMGMRNPRLQTAPDEAVPFPGTAIMSRSQRHWYEFFAGGGMARLGLGSAWKCTFANDLCEKKASAYRAFFGPSPELKVDDVGLLTTKDLPGVPDLVWASFPCQDLSLAGNGAGLDGKRSGTFRPFWRLVSSMVSEGRAPKLVVLENVTGALTSHSGSDYTSIVSAFAESGYRVGALIINAACFLPQSRPRLFLVGLHGESPVPTELASVAPSEPWHTKSLIKAHERLPARLARSWVWWTLPAPKRAISTLESLIEDQPTGTAWHTESETRRLLRLMTAAHRDRVADASRTGQRLVGTIYKRTRPNRNDVMVQRAEVRFDGISGCLRTPVGGSSRQTVIIVDKGRIRTRLLSPREAARLMGVPDSYPLPAAYNEAYHLFGDGVAVPVVSWLENYLLRPLAGPRRFEQVA
jgi:DNA (cytosine-5)-methyltransferase 1